MHKYILKLVLFVVGCLLWFIILPIYFDFSFPTGGWDWLSFVATLGSVYFAFDGILLQLKDNNEKILEQQRLSVVPCLDIDAYTPFNACTHNNSFRIYKEFNDCIFNDGYSILRTDTKEVPKGFQPKININVRNIGLSTAMQVEVYFKKLTEVEGLDSLEKIALYPISDFYKKVKFCNYEFIETEDKNAEIRNYDWLISPQYNLSTYENSEFNLIFDLSKITKKYHSILKFVFSDVYGNKYYQLMYLYFDNKKTQVYPVSKVEIQ